MRGNDTCHREPSADLLGVYGGVTNQEIADYLKAHDR